MGLPITGEYPPDWKRIALIVKAEAGFKCVRCHHPNDLKSGHVLTVHHLNGDKSLCRFEDGEICWWNLIPLCQKCHLSVQSRVSPEQPYFLEHSEWFKPYVAGFYAWKYWNREMSREGVLMQLDELLGLERVA